VILDYKMNLSDHNLAIHIGFRKLRNYCPVFLSPPEIYYELVIFDYECQILMCEMADIL